MIITHLVIILNSLYAIDRQKLVICSSIELCVWHSSLLSRHRIMTRVSYIGRLRRYERKKLCTTISLLVLALLVVCWQTV
jgi:hypothetical protein